MHRLHAGRFTRFIVTTGSALVLGLLLPVSGAAANSTAASITDPAYPDAPAGAYDIYKELPCQCWDGQTAIAYRVGYYIPPSTGFGHTKVLDKHNMYTPVVTFIVSGPNNSQTSGTSGEAYAYAAHIVNGQVQQVLKIIAKYDTRKLSDNHSFGIVTAWCDGIQGACPQWVNEAINASQTPDTMWPTNGTELSYDAPPLSGRTRRSVTGAPRRRRSGQISPARKAVSNGVFPTRELLLRKEPKNGVEVIFFAGKAESDSIASRLVLQADPVHLDMLKGRTPDPSGVPAEQDQADRSQVIA